MATIETVAIFDATGANVKSLPAGQHAGYVTGSGGIPWTSGEWAAHSHAVRIDQSPASGPWDSLADVQDFEAGAVTLAEVAPRIIESQAAWHAGKRPGQRWPAVYVGARPHMTTVVNSLIAAGIKSGVPFAIAAPGMADIAAKALITSTHGTPWPVVWVQNGFHGTYDSGWVSVPWLHAVSAAPAPKAPAIPDMLKAIDAKLNAIIAKLDQAGKAL